MISRLTVGLAAAVIALAGPANAISTAVSAMIERCIGAPRDAPSLKWWRYSRASARSVKAAPAITFALAIMSSMPTHSSGWCARSRMPGP